MTHEYASVRDFDLRSKRVLLRVDFNLPMENGIVQDETRLQAALPTIELLQAQGSRIIILSHVGRPKGKIVTALSLEPIAKLLAQRLKHPVAFVHDCIGAQAEQAVAVLKDGEILMLENLRFHSEEEENAPSFVEALARLGDFYVNDAFGTAHRAHASTTGIAHRLPSAAGLLMEAELESLECLLNAASSPFVCAIGGSKVADKVRVFESLLDTVDAFVVGGGMANTFLAAEGKPVGTSLRDLNLQAAQRILALAQAKGVKIHLPSDAIASPSFEDEASACATTLEALGERMILDIGPQTAARYAEILKTAKTIIFNGPMGVYEKPAYRSGTLAVCAAIAEATKDGATSVIGGGDAAAASELLGFGNAYTHISTGGGALLEFLEGKTLPGVAALRKTSR